MGAAAISALSLLDWSLLAACTAVAAAVQAATGFGYGLLTVPFFLLIMDSSAAVQLTIVHSFAISLLLLPRLLPVAPWALLAWLIVGSVVGFPLGIALYNYADLALIKMAVAVSILLVVGRILIPTKSAADTAKNVKRPLVEFAVGVLSGAMTACLAMAGPAVLLYLAQVRAPKQLARAATLTLFLFSYGGALLAQVTLADVTAETWRIAAVLTPLALLGAWLGQYGAGRLSEHGFRVAVLTILTVAGFYLAATVIM